MCHGVFGSKGSLLAHARVRYDARSLEELQAVYKGGQAHLEQKRTLNRIDNKVAFSEDPDKARMVNSTQVIETSTPPSDITWGTRGKRR
jgi:hypothetical protein